ncbi:ATP-binding protein [Amycolatopsis rubida]|uniref:ATP-binding protein n=1 Tax=Amycolatopsis rubida TaxID=112413 RepID=UPI000B85AF4B|nr:ATP-binding protein [Amycolatopsis rubida]
MNSNENDRHPADYAHEPLTTREGWQRFVHHTPEPPALLTADERAGMDDLELELHQALRLDYHSELVVVNTPMVTQVINTGYELMLVNRRQLAGARRGMAVFGPAGTGKTTAVTQLGRAHELRVRRRHPQSGPEIPVVYLTVPPAATPRMLAVEFARFLALPLGARNNLADVVHSVCGVLADAGTSLVIVDEIHNLNLGTRSGAEVSDQLKYFAERIPATFVYAGIDVERIGLFSGTRGRQLASRFTPIPTTGFAYGTKLQRQQWRALIITLESALRLAEHRPGALARLDQYLHLRTAGMIGSLSHLIRAAAMRAIRDGTEKITKSHLAGVALDYAAANQPRATPGIDSAPRGTAATP